MDYSQPNIEIIFCCLVLVVLKTVAMTWLGLRMKPIFLIIIVTPVHVCVTADTVQSAVL